MPSSTEAETHDRSNGANGAYASKNMEPMSFHDGLSGHDLDDSILVRLGKKPVLKRNFGYMSILGFSCTILITWEATMFLFAQGFQNGGPAGVVYGYLLVWAGTLSTFATLSELASMAPISGGQYHWVAMLSPPSSQRFLSYITGWLTVCGWQAFVASAGYLTGTMIQGLIVLVDDSYVFQAWHGTLLFWAVIFFAVFVNTVVSSLLPKFEGLILILHVAGFFAILIPLVVLGPHSSASDVFQTFINGGAWPTQGVSFFVGLLGNVFAFFGADGAIHMSEEIKNAAVVVPRSILTAIFLNGTLGLCMLIAFLFCIGDIDAALNTPTGYPFMEIFQQAVQSTAGAGVMTALILTLTICATVGVVASASRVLWSFARDRAVPGWRLWQKVHPKTLIPVPVIALTTLISCLLSLIILGSSTAFNDIVSLAVAALVCSYLLVSGLLLWRRLTGAIKLESEAPLGLANAPGQQLTWGPWRIPGIYGVLNNLFACVYLVVILFFSFWPPATPTTAPTMNYSSLMLGATMTFSVVYYFLWGNKTFAGPVIEVQ